MWRTLSTEEKQPYQDKHDADQQRHDREMEEFNLKGYFTMQDGRLSKDLDAEQKAKLELLKEKEENKRKAQESKEEHKKRLASKRKSAL